MKAQIENYRGIEFVRLSSLPGDQKKMIRDSHFVNKTIKILRENKLITDCLPYKSYLEWYSLNERFIANTSAEPIKEENLRFAVS